jgi:hypothetical protein
MIKLTKKIAFISLAFSVVLYFAIYSTGHLVKSFTTSTKVVSHVDLNGIEFKKETKRTLSDKQQAFIVEKIIYNKIGNTTIVSIAHYGQRKSVQSWISSLEKNRFYNFTVLCFDQKLVKFLTRKGYKRNAVLIPLEWITDLTRLVILKDEHVAQIKISKSKSLIWYNLLLLNLSFVYSEPDVVWMKRSVLEHLEYKFNYSYAEVLFTQDPVSRGLCYNTGFFNARATPFVKSLFMKILTEQKVADRSSDIGKETLNRILQSSNFNDSRIGGLDLLLYASSSIYFEQNLNHKMNIAPLVVFQNHSIDIKLISRSGFDNSWLYNINRTLTHTNVTGKATLSENIEARLAQIMNDNFIDYTTIITIGNYGFREFILNWILSLKKCHLNKFVVFSYDQSLVDYLTEKGYRDNVILVSSKWLNYNLTTNFSAWGQDAYKLIAESKTVILNNLLMRNYSVITCDTDVVWLNKHILSHIRFQYEHSFAELLLTPDAQPRKPFHNTGFFYATPTHFVKTLFETILQLQQTKKYRHVAQQSILGFALWPRWKSYPDKVQRHSYRHTRLAVIPERQDSHS